MGLSVTDKLYGVLNAVRVALKMGDHDDLKELLPRIDEVLKEAEDAGTLGCHDCAAIFPTVEAQHEHAAETGHDCGPGCGCTDQECPHCNGGCGARPEYYATLDGKEVVYCEDCASHAGDKGIDTGELAGRFSR